MYPTSTFEIVMSFVVIAVVFIIMAFLRRRSAPNDGGNAAAVVAVTAKKEEQELQPSSKEDVALHPVVREMRDSLRRLRAKVGTTEGAISWGELWIKRATDAMSECLPEIDHALDSIDYIVKQGSEPYVSRSFRDVPMGEVANARMLVNQAVEEAKMLRTDFQKKRERISSFV